MAKVHQFDVVVVGGGGAGIAGGVSRAGRVRDGAGENHARLSVAGEVGDSYAGAGVSRWASRGAGAVGELLPGVAEAGGGAWGTECCFSGD